VDKRDTSGVKLPPPLVYLAGLAIGFLLEWLWPSALLSGFLGALFGYTIIALSLILFAACLWEFYQARTPVDHGHATRTIIESGPYRFSRNPIYVSMTLLVIGIALASGSLWVLLMSAPSVYIVHRFVILKEEAYLEARFGQDYLNYKAKVRRWV
jgi:protein-S-isoprenylcysteine O-methyltransferase Ste14